jgi:hypothetical protein
MRSLTFRADPIVMTSVVNGETVLLDNERNMYYSIDPTGTYVLDLLRRGMRVEDIVPAMVGRFGMTPQSAQSDLRDFLEQMLDAGLIVRVRQPGLDPTP